MWAECMGGERRRERPAKPGNSTLVLNLLLPIAVGDPASAAAGLQGSSRQLKSVMKYQIGSSFAPGAGRCR